MHYTDRLLAFIALPICTFALVLHWAHWHSAVKHIGSWLEGWPGVHHSIRSHGSDLYYAGHYGKGRYGNGRVFLPKYTPWSFRTNHS